MTHLDDAHTALQFAVASAAAIVSVTLTQEQAGALLDEAARLVAERDRERAKVAWLTTAHTDALDAWVAAAEQRDAAIEERDHLRCVLRPLLLRPWAGVAPTRCLFCTAEERDGHAADCPTRQSGRLLGDETTLADVAAALAEQEG